MAAANPQPGAVPGTMAPPTDPLAALRDIHEPGMIVTWPPAPGWWILAGLALLALIWLMVWCYQRWRNNRYRREAAHELRALKNQWEQHQDDQAYLLGVQALLKRVALTRFPREAVASLTGEAWVQFLDQSTGSHDFSMGEAEALIDGGYRASTSVNVEILHEMAGRWIDRHDPEHLRQTEDAAR